QTYFSIRSSANRITTTINRYDVPVINARPLLCLELFGFLNHLLVITHRVCDANTKNRVGPNNTAAKTPKEFNVVRIKFTIKSPLGRNNSIICCWFAVKYRVPFKFFFYFVYSLLCHSYSPLILSSSIALAFQYSTRHRSNVARCSAVNPAPAT